MNHRHYIEDLPGSVDMASEPVGVYGDVSLKFRHSGILHEIRQLDKNDTIWLIRYMERHLEQLYSADGITGSNVTTDPLECLDEIGLFVQETGKTVKDLVDEHLKEKYAV